METNFDTLRENFSILSQREFTDESSRQAYLTRIESSKEIADALHDLRDSPGFAITTADECFTDTLVPTTREDCAQISNNYMNMTDEEHSSYSATNLKTNTAFAIAYIHWEYRHIVNHHHTSKLTLVQAITNKLVNCTVQWGYTIKTTKEQFLQIANDLRDNKPLIEIMNNFHLDDLYCYGY